MKSITIDTLFIKVSTCWHGLKMVCLLAIMTALPLNAQVADIPNLFGFDAVGKLMLIPYEQCPRQRPIMVSLCENVIIIHYVNNKIRVVRMAKIDGGIFSEFAAGEIVSEQSGDNKIYRISNPKPFVLAQDANIKIRKNFAEINSVGFGLTDSNGSNNSSHNDDEWIEVIIQLPSGSALYIEKGSPSTCSGDLTWSNFMLGIESTIDWNKCERPIADVIEFKPCIQYFKDKLDDDTELKLNIISFGDAPLSSIARNDCFWEISKKRNDAIDASMSVEIIPNVVQCKIGEMSTVPLKHSDRKLFNSFFANISSAKIIGDPSKAYIGSEGVVRFMTLSASKRFVYNYPVAIETKISVNNVNIWRPVLGLIHKKVKTENK